MKPWRNFTEGPQCKILPEGGGGGATLGGKYEGNDKGEGGGESTIGGGKREKGKGGVRKGFTSVEIRIKKL